uniref:Uncharacterized protein n=1 Tax=Brassica campestris TaxID=3711 RepID=M4E3A0_BRACM
MHPKSKENPNKGPYWMKGCSRKLEMEIGFSHPVPTAVGSSSSGSQRACPTRAAVFRMANQTRTAKHVDLRGSVRGTRDYKQIYSSSTLQDIIEDASDASWRINTHQYVRIELEMKTTMHASKAKLRWWILEE